MIGRKNRVSCRNLFGRLEILPFVSQYILSLTPFVVRNKHLFTLNSENHTKSTRQFNNFYHLITNFTIHQRAVHYMGIKVFNSLPPYIKDISNIVKNFEICLKQFLHTHSFYSLEEYFQHKSITS
jgi:hypothetical protein